MVACAGQHATTHDAVCRPGHDCPPSVNSDCSGPVNLYGNSYPRMSDVLLSLSNVCALTVDLELAMSVFVE